MCFLFDHRLSGYKIWGKKTLKAKKKKMSSNLTLKQTYQPK